MTAAVVQSCSFRNVFGYCQNGWHRCEIASRPIAGCATKDEASESVPCPSGVAPMGADRSKKERPSFAGGSRVARGWGFAHEYNFNGSHAARCMGARKGDRCELRNIPSRDKASITRQHMPSIGRQSPGSRFWSCGGRDCDRVKLALERSSDGKPGSRKPTQ
jgi:hypothetical protein